MRLIYHPDAEAELIQAARFYESRVSTLGSEFLDAADRAIAVISCPAFPTLFTIAFSPITFAFLRSSITVGTQTTGGIDCRTRPRTPNRVILSFA